jgi:hypothetical protein
MTIELPSFSEDFVIPLGRLQIRSIQWYLMEFWHPVTQMWEACIPVPPRLLPHLQWWLQHIFQQGIVQIGMDEN